MFVPKTQIGKLYSEANLWQQKTIDDFCKALAKIPLRNEPGTVWEYGHSTDVLGRVIEVISGQPFNVFLRDRIITPLKMVDTDFVCLNPSGPALSACIRRTVTVASAR